MKRIVQLILFFLLYATGSSAQYILDTPDGKKVRLNKDGTWSFITSNNAELKKNTIPTTSTTKYVSKFNKYAIWYNPTQWLCDTTKKENDVTWDATFYSKDLAVTGYYMESRLSSPTSEFEATVRSQYSGYGEVKSFVNFKDTINNLPLYGFDLFLEYGGVTYQYRGYVYSTLRGSFQFTVGTQKEVFEEDKDKIKELFQGLIKL
ncbi:MAG TPA: hypothetical protein VF476_14555 [Chitinophagaceae bacterium]